jgi:hypothetical protein
VAAQTAAMSFLEFPANSVIQNRVIRSGKQLASLFSVRQSHRSRERVDREPPEIQEDTSENKIAGNGNRTRMASLEGWNFTIKLCPQGKEKLPRPFLAAKFFLAANLRRK